MSADFKAAREAMLQQFIGNAWFKEQHWPENEERVRFMANDIQRLLSSRSAALFEPGCGNGFISLLFAHMGYRVTACDSWDLPSRDELFRAAGVQYFPANLNDLDPFPDIPNAVFDAVLFGEVFEHLLNHPQGVLQQIARVLRPGGFLILTTPNPSTLANAIRVLCDRYSPWGAETFIESPKFADGRIIDRGDIHYREYRTVEVAGALRRSGFTVETIRYLPVGATARQSAFKRVSKSLVGKLGLRIFGSTQYLLASRKGLHAFPPDNV